MQVSQVIRNVRAAWHHELKKLFLLHFNAVSHVVGPNQELLNLFNQDGSVNATVGEALLTRREYRAATVLNDEGNQASVEPYGTMHFREYLLATAKEFTSSDTEKSINHIPATHLAYCELVVSQ